MAQAIAAALRGDEESRKLGRGHALLGIPWCCPEGTDMLAYALGYADGASERKCGTGRSAQPERRQ